MSDSKTNKPEIDSAGGEAVWFFAYGSDMDPLRFEMRIGEYLERRRASLPGYVLRFTADVIDSGGGAANIVANAGERVFGGVFRITCDQMAELDQLEQDPSRDPAGLLKRIQVTLETEQGPLQAQTYMIQTLAKYWAPSGVYLGRMVSGLEELGYEEEVLVEVRHVATLMPGGG